MLSDSIGPAATAAVKVTELGPLDSVSVWFPLTVPSVHSSGRSAATPAASVVTAASSVDPPPETLTLTNAPLMALSFASLSTAEIVVATGWPTTPVKFVDPTATSLAGAPATDVTLRTRGARLPTVIVRVLIPTVFPSVHVPTVVVGAVDFVGALAMVPPPAVTLMLTDAPAIGLPSLSLTTKVGATGSTEPAAAALAGATVNAIEDGTAFGPEESPQAAKPMARPAATMTMWVRIYRWDESPQRLVKRADSQDWNRRESRGVRRASLPPSYIAPPGISSADLP